MTSFWWLAADNRIPVFTSSGATVVPILESVSICIRNLVMITKITIVFVTNHLFECILACWCFVIPQQKFTYFLNPKLPCELLLGLAFGLFLSHWNRFPYSFSMVVLAKLKITFPNVWITFASGKLVLALVMQCTPILWWLSADQ